MEVVIFDVDGVLANFDKLRSLRDKAHIRAVAKKKKISIPEAKDLFLKTKQNLRKRGKHSTIDTMEYLEITKQEFYEIMNSVDVKGRVVIRPGAQKVLRKLSKKHKIAALTNTPYDATVKTLKYLRLYSFFDGIYTIDKYDFIKPSPAIFKRILQDFNCKKGWSVGDSIEKDLEPARKVGLKTVLVDKETKLTEVLK